MLSDPLPALKSKIKNWICGTGKIGTVENAKVENAGVEIYSSVDMKRNLKKEITHHYVSTDIKADDNRPSEEEENDAVELTAARFASWRRFITTFLSVRSWLRVK